ncbi:DODA-type extradiol aromatic ring-opening family dioxygenase [Aneurinibacillus uraniidurans]|uniref:DODA-type extradiol aromatic ring-opening family dioxygenase n=1 Tax=Aneurinibacillus uraniidurans TaxID=2966586 RepID=UPI00234B1403|nr:class III extradiol ring-cleavage dioxygenase [Aneurinibacillus sp. B1]WCN37464.1 class III extradiol ring-cleavage dioxygenase [Aneurinibacillus sp. B1]
MMPAFFLAHGAPSLVIEENSYTEFLSKLVAELPRPKAIVVFTAHWESDVQLISSAQTHRTLYDFSGFPAEMYEMTYPAPGDPELAGSITKLLANEGIPSRQDDTRPLDHGVWALLKLMYPNADIPVVAMSVNPFLPPAEQYRIGQALAPLRDEDVLIIGSGGTVHNLRRLQWGGGQPEPWAMEFDQWVNEKLVTWNTEDMFRYDELAPHVREAVPRNEHFIPLLPIMGAGDRTRQAALLHQVYQYGSLSLSAWKFE